MRRTWLRGRENVHQRYLVHVAGHNLGILMRLLIGSGTPKEAAARFVAWLFFPYTGQAALIILVAPSGDDLAVLMIGVPANHPGSSNRHFNGLLPDGTAGVPPIDGVSRRLRLTLGR